MLRIVGIRGLLKVVDVVLRGIPRRVNGEGPVVQEKGLFPIGVNELCRFVGHAFFDMCAGFGRQRGIVDERPRSQVSTARARSARGMGEIDVKSLMNGFVRSAMAQMPFAKVGGAITRGVQMFGQCGVLRFQTCQ